MAAGKQSDKNAADGPKAASSRRRVQSDIPKVTLEDALKIAETIESANGGRPYPPADTAIALDISPGSSGWRTLTSASNKYGLTTGTYKSERLSLTELGVRIVSPVSPEDRTAALVEAALGPATFRSIFDHFKGKKIPERQFLENTIAREFDVPKEHAAVCADVFTSNAEFLGLARSTKGGSWLGHEPSLVQQDLADEENEDDTDDESESEGPNDATDPERERPQPPPADSPRNRGKGKAVFLGHGKNKKPLEQLEKILTEYGVPFKTAVSEPNQGRPISQKVAQTMDECGAAILIFTADEEFRTLDGDEVWRPSENVIYELGAAAILYGNRIIVFKEAGVSFPTNFRDIGYIEFDKDSLAAKGIDLFRELIAFKIIQVSVPDA